MVTIGETSFFDTTWPSVPLDGTYTARSLREIVIYSGLVSISENELSLRGQLRARGATGWTFALQPPFLCKPIQYALE
jgi:hypothetical protein